VGTLIFIALCMCVRILIVSLQLWTAVFYHQYAMLSNAAVTYFMSVITGNYTLAHLRKT